jgi:hypothetical protein
MKLGFCSGRLSGFLLTRPRRYLKDNLTSNQCPGKKGQSGNPQGIGIGKEKLMRQALMMELKSAGEDLPELRQIARRVIDCALHDEENWSWAVKEVWDRLDGKPQQPVEPIIAEKRSALDWSTDELVAFSMSQQVANELLKRRRATENLTAFTFREPLKTTDAFRPIWKSEPSYFRRFTVWVEH